MKRFNDWFALLVSDKVATMGAVYLFAIIGLMGVTGALTGNVKLVLIIGAISGYFLQLVLLPIIMVAGKLQADKTIHHVNKNHEEVKSHLLRLHDIATKGKK